jgi:hypothetical protein
MTLFATDYPWCAWPCVHNDGRSRQYWGRLDDRSVIHGLVVDEWDYLDPALTQVIVSLSTDRGRRRANERNMGFCGLDRRWRFTDRAAAANLVDRLLARRHHAIVTAEMEEATFAALRRCHREGIA